MRRDLGLILILGCLVILLLEVPVVMASMTRDLGGPYPEWTETERATAENRSAGTAPLLTTALVRDFGVPE